MSVQIKNAARHLRDIAASAVLVLAAANALADPADYVFTPYTDTQTWQLAYGLGTAHARDGGRQTQQTLSIGATPATRWHSSVYAAWAAADGGAFEADEWSWINHLQLTRPGAGPIDAGLLCELSRPHDREEGRLGVRCGPTLQLDTDDLQFNFNPLLGKHLGMEAPGKLALDYQWQAKGLVAPGIELGAQGFGSVGPWNHWSPAGQQEHTAGPAIFLKSHAFGGPIRLDAAWLFGVGQGSPKNVLRLRALHAF
jgi:hypothetical protein